MRREVMTTLCVVIVCTALGHPALAQEADGQSELAQELTNPLASLLTIPFQMNYDSGIGPADDGWKLQTNVQPVLPFDLGEDWNLITRTIVPVIWQDDLYPGAGSQWRNLEHVNPRRKM